jgi:putative endonuclease
MITTTAVGRAVEDKAQDILRTLPGTQILVRSFRVKMGEIDFICLEETELVFVEIRGRSRDGWVSGLESVTCQKRRRIENAARVFLSQYKGSAKSVRFDVWQWDGRRFEVIRNAW